MACRRRIRTMRVVRSSGSIRQPHGHVRRRYSASSDLSSYHSCIFPKKSYSRRQMSDSTSILVEAEMELRARRNRKRLSCAKTACASGSAGGSSRPPSAASPDARSSATRTSSLSEATGISAMSLPGAAIAVLATSACVGVIATSVTAIATTGTGRHQEMSTTSNVMVLLLYSYWCL